jgi:homoserine O-acetyltransferase
MMQVESYKLTIRPEAGGVLEDASLVYAQWGRLNAAGDNVVLLPSYYSGKHESYAPLIGPGRALDPERYFIVAPNMFGNGVSTSPSHVVRPDLFPAISVGDNVRAQHELLQHLGVTRVALAAGWSMGAMQALHWAMLYPDYVRSVVAVCGTAVCWPINSAFLEGLAMILEAACGPAPYLAEDKALAMFGRAYAGWAYSAPFFREALYRERGYASINALLDDWAQANQNHRAANLLAMLRTWAGAAMDKDAARDALGRITAQCTIVPSDTDSYFTVEDAAFEAQAIRNARLAPLNSPYGHLAGAPGRYPAETARIEEHFINALAQS